MIGNTQFIAKFLALHVIVKKDLYMLTDKANRHKNIMLRMRFLLAHVVQHVRFDPRESDVTLTLPHIEIILFCQT